jgi:hypothetical protein
MDGVASDISIGEFMSSAGENGWELCGCYPSGNVGVNRPIGPKGELRKCEDVNEEVTLSSNEFNSELIAISLVNLETDGVHRP